MHVLYHRGGPKPCYKPAISVRQIPGRHEIAHDNVLLLDGTQPKRGDGMLCGTCGEPIHPQWLYDSPLAAEFKGLVMTKHDNCISVSF